MSLRSLACPLLFVATDAPAPAAQDPWFRDIAVQLGIDIVHRDSRSGAKYYVESAASGGGFLDYDGDGDLDIYLINGAPTPGSEDQRPAPNRLYEYRDRRFHDTTANAGVGDTGYGMGMCAGDVDADGKLDFLVSNYGADRLYHNLGGGRFEEIGKAAGVADPRWSTSCAFGDLDGDGDLDLYVAHYVDFEFARNPFCGDRARNLRAYCRPEAFAGVPDSLFINRGDGTFTDQSRERGIVTEGQNEKGFGVVLTDLDDDGDLDIFVANDGTMNRLYQNDGRGHFRDQALFSGAGLNAAGRAESSMGVDAQDVDGDGKIDVVVTNYSMESNTLYRNTGGLLFEDITRRAGLVEASYPYVGWGVRLFDADNDSRLDLVVANGHAIDNIEIFEAGLSYRQPKQLFLGDGAGRFTEVTERAGPAFALRRVSRGLAVGDLDDDGRLDLLITNTNDRPELLHNRLANGHHWLGVRLAGPPANPFAIGARGVVRLPGRLLVAEVRSGGSFLSQSDLRLHFGLGSHAAPVELEIVWPDGTRQHERVATLDRYLTVRLRDERHRGAR